jgi:predicted O-methyltransferase YrrM/ABC-type transporter Mla subunit MlaD
MSPQRRVTWLSSNPWGKRVAVFVTGAACAAMLLLGLWLESKWLVAGAVATGGGAFALLLLLVFRRVGYLIVLHRATGQGLSLLAEEQMRLKDGLDRLSGRQGRLEDSVNHLSRAQQRLAEDLVRWGLPGYRELLLGAYREHAQSQESIGEAVSKAKDQLAQVQQRIDRLQADMGVLSRSLDETLPALNMRLAGQEEGLSRTLAKLDRSLQEALDQNEQKAVSRHAQLEKWLLEQLAELLRQGGQMADLLGSVEDRLASQEEGTGQTVQAIERFRQSLDQVADMLAEISRQSGSVDQHVKRALSELKTAREVVSARSEAMQGLLEKIDRNIEARLAAKIDKVTHAIDNGDLRFPLLNDINAMNRLQQRFSPPASLPMMSGWALDAVSLERLIEAVLEHRPRTIVECGSGVSTVWLAYAAREFGGKVVALEHKEKFAEQTRDDLRRHGLLDVADVRLAPLEDIEFDGQVFPWYCKEAWRDLSGIDMLLVDGPPKATGPRARYPALPALGSSLSNGCVVVFDDINRKDEKEILDSWLEAYPKLGKPVAIGDRTVLMEWGAVSSDEHGRS